MGKGVSQGYSDAIRRVKGVKSGIQYTIPVDEAVNRIRNGETPEFTTGTTPSRMLWVAEEGADKVQIEKDIKKCPTTPIIIPCPYFEEELLRNHGKMPHGGFVLRSGRTGRKMKPAYY